ncbi:MAG TPA: formylglycine-generating enzyme family protein, partial [Chthoniobacteraceae bacterium]
NPVAKSAPPASTAAVPHVTHPPPLARSSGSASVIRSVTRTVPPALPKVPSPAGSSIGTAPPPQPPPSPTYPAPPSALAALLGQKKLLYAAGGIGAFLLLLAVFFLGRTTTQKTLSPTPAPIASLIPTTPPAATPEPKAVGFEGRKPGDYKMIAGIAFRWCPPTGSNGFTMGSPLYEPGRNVDETQHQVVLTKGFWLAETELTQGQWQQITGTTVRQQAEKGLADETEYPFTPPNRERMRDYMGLKQSDAEKAIGVEESGMPMYWAPWPEAVAYCQRLTERERAAGRIPQGWEIGLPTEAQWEYACRAGTITATYGGDMIILGENNAPVLDDIAWYGGNSGVGYNGRGWDTTAWVGKAYQFATAGPRAVGQKQANAWGLRDMLGNMMEWCSDYYGPYPDSDVRDPQGPPTGLARVIRGGGWLLAPKACRAAARASNAPGVSGRVVGFRLSVAPIKPPIEPAAETTAAPRSLPRDVLAAFSGTSAGQRRIVGGVAFHWCPPTGPRGFVMGSPQTEVGRQLDEAQHRAILSNGFWIAETEITQAQWRQIMGTNVREQATLALNDETTYGNPPKTFRQFYSLKPNDLDKIVFGEEPNLPMYYVNWSDAATYCQRATQQARSQGQLPASWEIRLPTETQWEYAARAGTDTATYGGDLKILGKNNAPALDQIAWYGGNSGVGYRGKGLPTGSYPEKQYTFTVAGPRAVGKKAANPWGLMDSIGNLGEWCADWYGPYPTGPVVDPEGPPAGGFRVLRGASFDAQAFLCRSAARISFAPTLRNWDFGFRPVIVPSGR